MLQLLLFCESDNSRVKDCWKTGLRLHAVNQWQNTYRLYVYHFGISCIIVRAAVLTAWLGPAITILTVQH